MKESLISVIVPVYNVEIYLHQCIQSIINQTYKNLEIILIDDGSTDSSGVICDEYALKDERVVVIHQKNGGLSAARNSGLQVAKGDWIAFVDSDDWIHFEMYERLVNGGMEHEADLVLCGFVYDSDYDGKCGGTEVYTFDRDTLLETYYYPQKGYRISTSVWNRLYRRSLIMGMEFPVGKLNEDIFFTVDVFSKCKSAVYVNEKLYVYRYMREGSITATMYTKKKMSDTISLFEQAENRLIEIGREDLAQSCYCKLYTMVSAAYASRIDNETRHMLHSYRKKNRKKVRMFILRGSITNYEKIVLVLNYFSPRLKSFLEMQLNRRGMLG